MFINQADSEQLDRIRQALDEQASIEQSPEMLAAAQKHCQESIQIPVTFTPILCHIQEIMELQQRTPRWSLCPV